MNVRVSLSGGNAVEATVSDDVVDLIAHFSMIFGEVTGVEVLPDSSLQEAKALKEEEIRAACEAAVTGGFISEALGILLTYPSSLTDQLNLNGSITQTVLPTTPPERIAFFSCSDDGGV